jgi:putative MATE family efflux protein
MRSPWSVSPALRSPTRVNAQDREIARLAVPAFAALVSEPLFLLADAAIVGHLGTSQLAALGIAGTVVQTGINLFIFLAYGTTSTVARSVGAEDPGAALSAGIDGYWLALLIGILVTAVMELAAPNLIGLFTENVPVGTYALTYLRIAAFGVPALLIALAGAGTLRGLKDTRTPLAISVTANLLNIGFNATFVYGLDWGIAGSALGTLVAQGLAASAYVVVVVRAARRQGAALRPHRRGVAGAWRTGVPLLVRTLSLRIALLVSTYVAAGISTFALAAQQVAFTVWTFLAFALDAIAIAGQAIAGQLLGAGNARGARLATRRMMQWGVAVGGVLGLLLTATRPVFVPLFSSDASVQVLLMSVLLIVALQQPVAGVVFVLDGVLIGAGDGRYLAWAGLFNVLVFVPLALAVHWSGGGLVALWWAFTAFMLARLATLLWRERSDAWLVLGAGRL